MRDPLSPVPFPGHESVNTFLLNRPDIFQVRISMDRFLGSPAFYTLLLRCIPSTPQLLFSAALPNCAERRTPSVMAPLLTPELHHSPKQLVVLVVIRGKFAKRRIRNGSGEILCAPQFFSQIEGKVGDLFGIPVTVKTAEPANVITSRFFLP
jgi:hypothetical protein